MARNIIVPIDGSTVAEAALRVAYGIAERCGATVTAIRVGEPHDDDAEADLARSVRRFADSAPTKTLFLDGTPAERILEVGDDADSMICMATHGRSGIRRLVLGSVAEEIVRRSAHPVIVVGPNGAMTPLRSERARMVVCTDGSPAASAVLTAAAALASDIDLSCDVVQVAPSDEDVSIDLELSPTPQRDRAEQQCAEYCEHLERLHISATPAVLHGEPARSITHHAAARHASFIAVATHGRTGLSRVALGSTAANIVRHAPCPVLIARTTAAHSG